MSDHDTMARATQHAEAFAAKLMDRQLQALGRAGIAQEAAAVILRAIAARAAALAQAVREMPLGSGHDVLDRPAP